MTVAADIHASALAVPAVDRVRTRAQTGEMIARERWPRERLLLYQRALLHETLAHAVAESPYYRQRIDLPRGGDVRLEDLPVLTKTTLMNDFDQIVTDRRLRLADVERHLASDRAADAILGKYRAFATGGTTGERAIVLYDPPAWDTIVANVQRWLAVVGADPNARNVGIGAPTPLHLTNRVFPEIRAAESDAPRLSVTMPMIDIVTALNTYRPDMLLTYPSLLRRLVEEQREGRLRIAPRLLCSAAETLTPDMRELVRQSWGGDLFDSYGTTETGLIGIDCPEHAGIHVAEDLLMYEVVDRNNRPVAPGEVGEKVLVTTLFNRVLPLIRYEISDLVTLADGACRCGRSLLRLAAIAGRREDVLDLPAHGGGRVGLHAVRLRGPLLQMAEVRQFQVTPLPAGLCIRIALRSIAEHERTLCSVRRLVQRELDDAGAIVQTLTVEIVDCIDRVGTGAKEKLVAISH
jgi:phenylacetate-CoA ligase